jgi:hypothetical protein
MIGSSSRTCTSNGWTGNHPFCDGKCSINPLPASPISVFK